MENTSSLAFTPSLATVGMANTSSGEEANLYYAQYNTHPFVIAATWINRVCLVLILAAGLVGNSLTLAVQQRLSRVESSPLSVFISALAVFDSLVLLLTTPYWFLLSYGIDLSHFHDAVCKLFYFFSFSVVHCSSWMLVSMTVYRAASIVWPHWASGSFSSKKAKIAVLVHFSLALLLYAHALYGLTHQRLGTGQVVCGFASVEYYKFYSAAFFWMQTFIGSLIPFALLIVSNSVIIKRVGQAMKDARHKLAAGTETQLRQRESKASSMNVTLICVSVTYLALTTPIRAIYIAKYARKAVFATDIETRALNYFLQTMSAALLSSNSAINFFIYILTGSRYRAEVAAMFCAR